MSISIRATIAHTPGPDRLELVDDAVLRVDDEGVIQSVEPNSPGPVDVSLDSDTLLVPGLVDTHIHAPQWPQLGTGLDLPLEQWLFEYTFPLEARYRDVDFAASVWDHMVPNLLSLGTTTAVYFGSIHRPATLALAEACVRHGQRAFVGRVAMDHPDGTPDWYRDSDPTTAVEESTLSINEIRGLGSPLVEPIITPRFVPACTDAALAGLGELAAETDTRVQTHCSESDWEHEYVLDRFGRTDTQTLDSFGLLRQNTILAHATHITASDRRRIAERGAGIAHCPLSNAYFANAVFAANRALEETIPVGLGTDVAGSPDPSIISQCGHAVAASRILEDGTEPATPGVPASRIDTTTAFWMATRGGAQALGIPAGLLAPGNYFDAVALTSTSPVTKGLDDPHRRFERVVRTATPLDISDVWVAGRKVR